MCCVASAPRSFHVTTKQPKQQRWIRAEKNAVSTSIPLSVFLPRKLAGSMEKPRSPSYLWHSGPVPIPAGGGVPRHPRGFAVLWQSSPPLSQSALPLRSSLWGRAAGFGSRVIVVCVCGSVQVIRRLACLYIPPAGDTQSQTLKSNQMTFTLNNVTWHLVYGWKCCLHSSNTAGKIEQILENT